MTERRWIVAFQQQAPGAVALVCVGPIDSLRELSISTLALGRAHYDGAWIFDVEPDMQQIAALLRAGKPIGEARGARTLVMLSESAARET